jgi:hypothetical protein
VILILGIDPSKVANILPVRILVNKLFWFVDGEGAADKPVGSARSVTAAAAGASK